MKQFICLPLSPPIWSEGEDCAGHRARSRRSAASSAVPAAAGTPQEPIQKLLEEEYKLSGARWGTEMTELAARDGCGI